MGAFEGIGGTVRKFNPPAVESESQSADVVVAEARPAPTDPMVFPPVEESISADKVDEEVTRAPLFTVVGVENADLLKISREYTPALTTVKSVANTGMLLQYMVGTEREYNVTMSFPACGVDTNVFDGAMQESLQAKSGDAYPASEGDIDGAEESAVTPAPAPEGQSENPEVVSITVPASEQSAAEHPELYEKIIVDGVPYLSCLSQCLNAEYLHQIIAEATEAVFTHNRYVYTLVGPRPLVKKGSAAGGEGQCFIETLKLNSYELSVLLAYMGAIEGISVEHGVFDGRSAITFTR